MQIDPTAMRTRDVYAWMTDLIIPRPIAWVSSLSSDGIANLAPFSYFNGVGSRPPSVVFCPANRRDGSRKDTLANIEATGQFVVNLVTPDVATAMNQSSAEYESDVDEFEMSDLHKAASARVAPPRVAEAVAALECELLQTIHLGTGPGGANLVIGRVVSMFVRDDLLGDDGRLRREAYQLVGRLGGSQYVQTEDRFEMPRPGQPPTRQA